jgi:hypothetical protein
VAEEKLGVQEPDVLPNETLRTPVASSYCARPTPDSAVHTCLHAETALHLMEKVHDHEAAKFALELADGAVRRERQDLQCSPYVGQRAFDSA